MLFPALQELSIALVNDKTMSELHYRFLGISTPTDVLTFELDHDEKNRVLSGEVIICIDEGRRQAKNRGTEPSRELLLYALHGMLHLCGFDDKTAAGYRAMHAKEDQILIELGIGAVFHRPPREPKQRQIKGRDLPIHGVKKPRSKARRSTARSHRDGVA